MEAISENGNQGAPSGAGVIAPGRRRTPWPLAAVAVLFVVVPFLTWYWTWFGRSLGDAEIESYLRDGNARHAQHALSQIAGRIEERDEKQRAGKRSDGDSSIDRPSAAPSLSSIVSRSAAASSPKRQVMLLVGAPVVAVSSRKRTLR